ncbi:MAG: allantoate amidohydrolase [Acidothermaceae bacterium]
MTDVEADPADVPPSVSAAFDSMWATLAPIGRAPSTGGYRRFAWTTADAELREWFAAEATARGLDVQCDRNGNVWAWWLPPGQHGEPADAFVTGSHLDSVPDGGAFDGPLGVVSALCAVDLLRTTQVAPTKPIAVVAFADEEGARFGVACVGSRLATGVLDPDRARALTDADGVSLAEAMTQAGADASKLGRDDEVLRRIGTFVELHIEQGRALADVEAALGVATGIWPHGRWHFSFTGKPDHAGTTRLADRHDPVLTFASATLAARQHAEKAASLATFGRVLVAPNATNGIAARVDAWLDARAPRQAVLDELVATIAAAATRQSALDRIGFAVACESMTPPVTFDEATRSHLRAALPDDLVPELPTGAGHDAGVLAAERPTGMIFVRNPSGVSHAPDEFAERADCLRGVAALANVMASWTGEVSSR